MLVTIILLVVCVLIGAVATPLMLRLIPPNPLYGVRTERTLSDEKAWFDVNEFGGRALLAAAGVTFLLIVVYSGTWLRSNWSQLAVLVLAVAAAVGATFHYQHKLPKRERRPPGDDA